MEHLINHAAANQQNDLDIMFEDLNQYYMQEHQQQEQQQINRVSKQIGELGNRLGEFVEWQVRPAVVRLFQERGIDVHEFHPGISVKRDNEGLEIKQQRGDRYQLLPAWIEHV